MTKQETEEELSSLFNGAPPYRQKQILDNVEFQLARKTDVSAAYQIAYGIIYGSGKTKREARRNAKKIKFEDSIAEFV